MTLLLALVVFAQAHGSHGWHAPAPKPIEHLPTAAVPSMPAAAQASAAVQLELSLEAPPLGPGPSVEGMPSAVEQAQSAAAPDAHAEISFDGEKPRAGAVDFLTGLALYPNVVGHVYNLADPVKREASAKKLLDLKRPETLPALRVAFRKNYVPPEGEFEKARRPVHYEALKRVVAVGAVFAVIEAVGSHFTGSGSLRADAMHLAADLMINVGSLYAAWAARQSADASSTYGSLKLEPLIGFVSAIAIAGMGLFAGFEAIHRLLDPQPLNALQTMLFALAGLASNGWSTWMLFKLRHDNLSVKGAFLHAATDALGSVGIIVAGGLILSFGWLWADPLITLLIVGLVLRTTWGLGRAAYDVLLDKVPPGVDLAELEKKLLAIPGVAKVEDLHVWSLNSAERAATVRLAVKYGVNHDAVVQAAKDALEATHPVVELSYR